MNLCLIFDPKYNWLDLVDWSVIHIKMQLACWTTIYHQSGDKKKNVILRAKRLYTEDQFIRVIMKDLKDVQEFNFESCALL